MLRYYRRETENMIVSEGVTRFLNILTHDVILFIVLLTFFKLIISKQEEMTLNEKLGGIIDGTIFNYLHKLNREDRHEFIEYINLSRPELEKLDKIYSEEDIEQTSHNFQITLNGLFMILILCTTILTLIFAIRYICYYDIIRDYGKMLLEIILLFIVVTSFEVLFYFIVAKHYIPLNDTEFTKLAVESFKNNL